MTGAMSDDETKHKAEGEALKIGDEPTPKIRRKIVNLNAFVYTKEEKKKKKGAVQGAKTVSMSAESAQQQRKEKETREMGVILEHTCTHTGLHTGLLKN